MTEQNPTTQVNDYWSGGRITIELPSHSISPELYRILTGQKAPMRVRIGYFARKCTRVCKIKFLGGAPDEVVCTGRY